MATNSIEQSSFVQWIDKYFKGIVVHIVDTINEKNKEDLTYLHKTMLRKELSITGKWESISNISSRVSADFVAMDSSLPLKRRDSFGKASGDIVKSGMELWINETQLTELDTMVAMGASDAEITAKLFADTPRVIIGIYELMEGTFLQGFSSGVTVLEDKDNVGTGVRLDYEYLDSNKAGVKTLWSDVNSKPLDDIKAMIKKAKAAGHTMTEVFMDDVTFDNFVKTQQVRDYFAWSFKSTTGVIPTPSLDDINPVLKRDSKFKFSIHVIDRRIIRERNGVREVVTPWAEGKVILTGTTEVGVLAYARLAEENHPTAGVSYQKAEEYILVSRFRQNRPSLAEFTTSQARVVPVICNVEQIYQLDTKLIQG